VNSLNKLCDLLVVVVGVEGLRVVVEASERESDEILLRPLTNSELAYPIDWFCEELVAATEQSFKTGDRTHQIIIPVRRQHFLATRFW